MNRLNTTLDALLFAVALPLACFVPLGAARFVVWFTPYAVWRDPLGYHESHHPPPSAPPHPAHSTLTLTPPPSTTTARHGADGARESLQVMIVGICTQCGHSARGGGEAAASS